MHIDFLINIFKKNLKKNSIVWKDNTFSYGWLLKEYELWINTLSDLKLKNGSTVVIESEISPRSLALLLALIENNCIVIPLTDSVRNKKNEFFDISSAEFTFKFDKNDNYEFREISQKKDNDLYQILRSNKSPGLVLFSSGSEGESKAAVHDFTKILKKYKTPRKDLKTLIFFLFDHIGGIDTLFYTLSNGSTVIPVIDRSPESICKLIEKHKIEVLPVSPTFLNLLFISEYYKNYDLSSLKYVTYGTEVMPKYTLDKCSEVFNDVIIMQKFGTTEVGTLRSKSKNSNSTWVKIGGEGYKTRINNGMLEIKAESAMLGYLNAPSPFTDDGWFMTGDQVEVNGEYIKILGRKSELINVGGEKVYPSEVENIIEQIKGINEVIVYGEKNPIMGHIVCCDVNIETGFNFNQVKKEIKSKCSEKLQAYKIPMKINLSDKKFHSSRFKKMRSIQND